MNVEQSFDHLEAKIGQAIKTVHRLRAERERIRKENEKLRALLEKQDQEIESVKAKNGEMRQSIQENRHLRENREQIASHVKSMLDKLKAAQPQTLGQRKSPAF